MKSIYERKFEDVTKGMRFFGLEDELKNKGGKFVGYTNEFYESCISGFYRYRIYELDGKNLSPRMGGNSVTNKLNKESGILSDSLFNLYFSFH